MSHPEIPQTAFDELAARAESYTVLDKAKLAALKADFHLRPPAPYDAMLSFENLGPDLDLRNLVAAAIEADADLSPEEKYALKEELYERWRLQVISYGSGEAFND
jgi:hypothetical protein